MKPSERNPQPSNDTADDPLATAASTSTEVHALDAALAARRTGLPRGDLRRSFGGEATELVDVAERMRSGGLPAANAPSSTFVAALESRLEEAWRTGGRAPTRRRALPHWLLATCAATVLAIVSVVANPAGFLRPEPTFTPTVRAADRTPSPAVPTPAAHSLDPGQRIVRRIALAVPAAERAPLTVHGTPPAN